MGRYENVKLALSSSLQVHKVVLHACSPCCCLPRLRPVHRLLFGEPCDKSRHPGLHGPRGVHTLRASADALSNALLSICATATCTNATTFLCGRGVQVVVCPDKHKPTDHKDRKDLRYTPVADAWAVGVSTGPCSSSSVLFGFYEGLQGEGWPC